MKIAFMGDTHGNFPYTRKALKHVANVGVSTVIHVGDFGVWSPFGFIRSVGDEAERLGITVYFVDGNHEDHVWLSAQPVRDDGFRELHPHVLHIPRGHSWEWEGKRFLGLGGAHSVDRQWRREGVDWFPEETITYSQGFRAGMVENVDYMITHDCPIGVEIPGIAGNPHGFPVEEIHLADNHRRMLGSVVDLVQPKVLVHGHYHVSYHAKRGETFVRGLDMDGTPFTSNMWTINTED